jgi:hypothetical protein
MVGRIVANAEPRVTIQSDVREFRKHRLAVKSSIVNSRGFTNVNRPSEIVRRVHGADYGFDQVVNVAEAPGLGAITVNGDILAVVRLHDEVRDHPVIIRVHAQPVLAPVVEE